MIAPIAMVEAYIFLAWSGLQVDSIILSTMLICMAFSFFAWSSKEILEWPKRFQRETPDEFPGKKLRIQLVSCELVVDGFYGVLFLLGFSGQIGAAKNDVNFATLDVTVKAAFLIVM